MDVQVTHAVKVKRQVLVADDDLIIRRMIVMLLNRLGHAGVVVEDGSKALACLAERSFDVILLDVMMPSMDGMATLAAFRRAEAARAQGQRQRIIMVTGHAEPGDTARLIAAGADGHIVKPIDAPQFQAELARVLQLH